jgi:predicted lipoprotein with Yx(FWY)xxD motif
VNQTPLAAVVEGMKAYGGGQTGGRHTWTRIALVGVAALSALALAACGDDSDDAGTATAAGGGTDTVSVESIGDAGDVLVDSDGAALYRTDQESSGKVACTGECLSFWQPLTVGAGEEPTASSDVEGELGTVMRPDGDTQVTLDGEPLYTFTEEGPGEVTGDEFVDAFDGTEFTWHVLTATASSDGAGSSSDGTDTSSSGGGGGYSY